jgi:hypothetical protein
MNFKLTNQITVGNESGCSASAIRKLAWAQSNQKPKTGPNQNIDFSVSQFGFGF